MDLLTVGEAFEDIIFSGLPRLPRLSEELRVNRLSTHPGGGAIITAIAACRLGARTATITAVSDANVRALRQEQVSLINLRRPAEHGAITVALSTPRDRAFVTYEGVNRLVEPRLLGAMTRLHRRPRHVHFALVPRRCGRWVPVVERLRRGGTTTSWDFGWHEELLEDHGFETLLKTVDWVFVNEREATFYSRTRSIASAQQAWQQQSRGAVLKLGPRGAIIIAEEGERYIPTRKTAAVDTTGAGDSFNAGFLVALLAGASLTDAARLGNYVGGRNVTAAGGIDGLPTRKRLPGWAQRILGAT